MAQLVGKPRREAGSASAELVVATPLLLLLLLAVVQFALWQHAVHVAQAVAQQGLAVGRVLGGSAAAARTQAVDMLAQLDGGVLVDASVTAARGAAVTTVTVGGYAPGLLPFLRLPVHSVAEGPTERFVPGGQP